MFQKQSTMTVKPNECIICFQAGNADYKTHRVKDKTGKVVCPTLLSQKCHVCKQTGHTPKYCKVAKLKKKHDVHIQNKVQQQPPVPIIVNRYQIDNDVADDEEQEETKEDTHLYRNSWANIVAAREPKTPPGPPPLHLLMPCEEDDEEDEYKPEIKPVRKSTVVYPASKKQKIEETVIITPVVEETETKKKPRPKLWSQYESDEEYE